MSLFTPARGNSEGPGSSASASAGLPPTSPDAVACPNCGGDWAPIEAHAEWQKCPYCEQRLQIRIWPVIRRRGNAAAAMPDVATCFFHPDNSFQACCQRCGRFVCALCDLQLGAEHVCPTCFDRGRADNLAESGFAGGKHEWRHRDVLYDSIALAMGWFWIVVWPVILVAIPATIFLHVKHRKAPRSYVVPRSGWRFWVAYAGFAWLPLLIVSLIYIPRWIAARH